jgi:hypothetical protein
MNSDVIKKRLTNNYVSITRLVAEVNDLNNRVVDMYSVMDVALKKGANSAQVQIDLN